MCCFKYSKGSYIKIDKKMFKTSPWSQVIFISQELNSVNYLELYRVADLFHLPALEEAVVDFLVEHLSELSQSRQDEALQLPYRLLREVLKSDRLTSLSEEEIWKVCYWLHSGLVCLRLCVYVCM